MTIQVKICGICDAAGAAAAIEAGADLLGFHFCPSDRRVTPEEAKAIIDGLSLRPTIVGVFIDQDAGEFVAVDQKVIGPFDSHLRCGDRVNCLSCSQGSGQR